MTGASTPRKRGEGHLFRALLGREWAAVAPHIRKRFGEVENAAYRGTMRIVRCSLMGRLFARATWYTRALIPFCSDDVPVDMRVTPDGPRAFVKERVYRFKNRKPFVFRSRMDIEDGRLMEWVSGGFGMELRLETHGGDLHFHSQRYVFRVGSWRLPLPHVLTMGDLYLLHRCEGDGRFSILIRIRHRWFGEMFRQEGMFEHAPLAPESRDSLARARVLAL